MKAFSRFQRFVLVPLVAVAGAGALMLSTDLLRPAPALAAVPLKAAAFPQPSWMVPTDINNGANGGAAHATIQDAATFAWQEFIALNWPAQRAGITYLRDTPDTNAKFGSDAAAQPTVWETYKAKVETFPGVGNPPGYVNGGNNGVQYPPKYVYGSRATDSKGNQLNPGGTPLNIPPCNGQAPVANPAWVNLDETSQIGLDHMFAGIVPFPGSAINAQPQLFRFLAKGNTQFYNYVEGRQFWYESAAFNKAEADFNNAAVANKYPPPPDSISLANGTILVKAAWRELGAGENLANFHSKTVRYYESSNTGVNPISNGICYREKVWVLAALHIIHKTPSAPYFVFATFEYTGNILNANGTPVEDINGNQIAAPAGDAITPSVNYFDADGTFYNATYPKGTKTVKPPPGTQLPNAQLAPGGAFCPVGGATNPQQNARAYYENFPNYGPPNSPDRNQGICVTKRYFAIPQPIIDVNKAAHAALQTYGAPGLWQNYKLVNVQWQPFNNADISLSGADTARLVSTYYQSNSVVETNTTLQQFFGGLFFPNNAPANLQALKSMFENESQAGGPAYNIYLPPAPKTAPLGGPFVRYVMGGCMGCHGRAQRGGTDFSFTLGNGPVAAPDTPLQEDVARLNKIHALLAGRPVKPIK